MNAKWYTVLNAEKAIFTDNEGKTHTHNVVSIGMGCVITFKYPEDGAKSLLIKEGSKIRFNEGNLCKENITETLL